MRVSQYVWTGSAGWNWSTGGGAPADIVFYFAAPSALDGGALTDLAGRFPGAHLIGCSTGGEIVGDDVREDCISAAAIKFDHTAVSVASVPCGGVQRSFEAGRALAAKFPRRGLCSLFVLSEGINVNGSELVRGLVSVFGPDLLITGGLAGDGARFGRTVVGLDGELAPDMIAAVGFYGDRLAVRHGSAGGWDAFGPKREITRSESNVLYELDGEPALDLYKSYLGDEAKRLPGSALLFPLRVHPPGQERAGLVRTVLSVDEAAHSLTFAGDVPQGHVAQLMRGNFDRLVEGAASAARQAASAHREPALGILVSCIGRKLLLGQRIGEEVETVAEILGRPTTIAGFYSYGEISPHAESGYCELHNQTMTVTVLQELPR
jgi:hypothetical protein